MTHVLDIPGWRPALDNELIYVHWSKARRLKRRDAGVLGRAALALGVPRATGRRRVAVTIRGRYGPGSRPDDGAPWKSLLDGLVAAGLLVDDRRDWCEVAWPPTYERGPRGTRILLEDI